MRFLVICFFLLHSLVYSQSYNNKYFDKALECYENNEIARAKKYLYMLLKDDKNNPNANILLAHIYEDKNQNKEALKYYDIALESLILENTNFSNDQLLDIVYIVIDLHFNNGNYSKSKYYTSVFDFLDFESDFINKVNNAVILKSNPVDFEPFNLGDLVNSDFDEYLPFVSRSNNMLFFTKNNQQEDIYVTYGDKISDDLWGYPNRLPINTNFNEGGGTLSKDGKTFLFTSCEKEDVVGGRGCDIYVSFLKNQSWSSPMNLSQINTEHWESQPCLSENGKELYFVSNRPGGYGKMDIWKVNIDENGFSQAINLGPIINSEGNEMSPFIHSDNITFYFASDEHLGLGGYDIFFSIKQNKKWSEPKNMGYPINTHNDENSLVVSSNGNTAYFASNNLDKGFGGMDLYKFNIPKKIQAFNVLDSKPIILRDIFFKYNSHEILPTSERELTRLVSFLKNNSNINISIYGHTDDIGSDEFNLNLSNLRAKEVYNYILSKNIDSKRLSYIGKGKCCPIESNENEEGRSLNRRIEFIIN